jgi:hypothetical protein
VRWPDDRIFPCGLWVHCGQLISQIGSRCGYGAVTMCWSLLCPRASYFAAWSDEDRYFPLEVELGALREAGFDEVECFWRRGASAITCALRAS